LPEKHTTPRGPKQDLPGRLSRDFRIYKLEKTVASGEGKKYPAGQCTVCAAHRERRESRNMCKACVVPFHKGSCFEKYPSVMNYYYFFQAPNFLVENFGLLNDLFPLPSILVAGYPVFDLHLADVLFDVILPSVLGSSL